MIRRPKATKMVAVASVDSLEKAGVRSGGIGRLSSGFDKRDPMRCMMCGGKDCPKCGIDAYKKISGPAISGFHSHWITDDIIAMQRPNEETLRNGALDEIIKKRITAVFNLCEPGEHPFCGTGVMTESGFPYLPDTFMSHGIKHFNFNWRDMAVPSLEMMDQIVSIACQEMAAGGRIAVHCHAGFGRTGLAVACILIAKEGLTADNVVTFVRNRRPGSIQTAQQQQFVYRFERHRHFIMQVFPTYDDDTTDSRTPKNIAAYSKSITASVEDQRHFLAPSDQMNRDYRFLHRVIYISSRSISRLCFGQFVIGCLAITGLNKLTVKRNNVDGFGVSSSQLGRDRDADAARVDFQPLNRAQTLRKRSSFVVATNSLSESSEETMLVDVKLELNQNNYQRILSLADVISADFRARGDSLSRISVSTKAESANSRQDLNNGGGSGGGGGLVTGVSSRLSRQAPSFKEGSTAAVAVSPGPGSHSARLPLSREASNLAGASRPTGALRQSASQKEDLTIARASVVTPPPMQDGDRSPLTQPLGVPTSAARALEDMEKPEPGPVSNTADTDPDRSVMDPAAALTGIGVAGATESIIRRDHSSTTISAPIEPADTKVRRNSRLMEPINTDKANQAYSPPAKLFMGLSMKSNTSLDNGSTHGSPKSLASQNSGTGSTNGSNGVTAMAALRANSLRMNTEQDYAKSKKMAANLIAQLLLDWLETRSDAIFSLECVLGLQEIWEKYGGIPKVVEEKGDDLSNGSGSNEASQKNSSHSSAGPANPTTMTPPPRMNNPDPSQTQSDYYSDVLVQSVYQLLNQDLNRCKLELLSALIEMYRFIRQAGLEHALRQQQQFAQQPGHDAPMPSPGNGTWDASGSETQALDALVGLRLAIACMQARKRVGGLVRRRGLVIDLVKVFLLKSSGSEYVVINNITFTAENYTQIQHSFGIGLLAQIDVIFRTLNLLVDTHWSSTWRQHIVKTNFPVSVSPIAGMSRSSSTRARAQSEPY